MKKYNDIEKELDCEIIHDKHFLNIKIKSYDDEAFYDTDFYDIQMCEVGSNYTWLAVILID